MIKLRSLLCDDRGSTIVELALITPLFATMVVGIVDLSNAFSRKLSLEQGAHRAIEKIMQTTETDTVEGTLKSEAICQVNGVNADGSCKTSPITVADVTVTYRLDCRNTSSGAITSQTTTDSTTFDTYTCASGTKASRYLEVTVVNLFTPMFPVRFSGYDTARNGYPIKATAGMRTE